MISQTTRVVLEGLPGAGKTTLGERLADALRAPLVPEWVGFSDRQWVTLPLKQPFYFANDELKEALARQLAAPVVLMDRHCASTLSFAWALDGEGHPNPRSDESWQGNLAWYRAALAEDRVSPPTITLWLDLPPEVSLERQPRARSFDPLWGDLERLAAMRRGYEHVFTHVQPTRVLRLDATCPADVIFEQALSVLR